MLDQSTLDLMEKSFGVNETKMSQDRFRRSDVDEKTRRNRKNSRNRAKKARRHNRR